MFHDIAQINRVSLGKLLHISMWNVEKLSLASPQQKNTPMGVFYRNLYHFINYCIKKRLPSNVN